MDTKSTSIIGAVVLLIIAIGLVLWYMSEHPAPFLNEHAGIGTATTTSTTAPTADQRLDEHAKYYDITATYPGSTRLTGQANAQSIEVMKQFETNAISAFKEQGNFDNLSAQDITTFGFDQGRKESLDIKYVTKTGPHTVSYIFTMFQDTLGAHPNTYFRTFTWNTTTGEGLELSDFFTGDYLAVLSKVSREKLPAIIAKKAGMPASQVDMEYLKRGTTPDTDNFTNWYIEGSSLVLIFPPYQVGPYVIGTQEVPLTLANLSGIKSQYK